MTWDVQESGGGAAAPSTAGLEKNKDYNPNSRTTQGLYTVPTPAGATPDVPGAILRQWTPTPLSLGMGRGLRRSRLALGRGRRHLRAELHEQQVRRDRATARPKLPEWLCRRLGG